MVTPWSFEETRRVGQVKLRFGIQYPELAIMWDEKENGEKYIKDAAALPCEKVWTKSFDGLNLCARLYVNDPKAPFDILFHGYKSGSIKDFSGGINLSLNNGHNVLLVDQRAHGDSEGHIISFGLNERFDVLSWVNYLIERYGNDILIGLYGISMGAATVIMASELDLPKNVKLVVADCPFSSAEDIIVKVTSETPCPLFLLKMFLHPLEAFGVDFFWNDSMGEQQVTKVWALNHYMFLDSGRANNKRPMLLGRGSVYAPHRYPIIYGGSSEISWEELGKINGSTYEEELLDEMFSRFCLGK